MAGKFLETVLGIYIIAIVLGIVIIIPAAGGTGLWDTITGWATTATSNAYININNPPQIIYVRATTPTVSITEDGRTTFNVTFLVQDLDGIADIINSTVFLRINLTNETDRMNYTCAGNGTVSKNIYSYRCQTEIWYFDGYGNWTINVSASDNQSETGYNSTVQFEVYSTTAIQMYPTNLTWRPLTLGAFNQTSDSDPLVINNTGNKDINPGSITVTAYNY